jgi:hypothetical protein
MSFDRQLLTVLCSCRPSHFYPSLLSSEIECLLSRNLPISKLPKRTGIKHTVGTMRNLSPVPASNSYRYQKVFFLSIDKASKSGIPTPPTIILLRRTDGTGTIDIRRQSRLLIFPLRLCFTTLSEGWKEVHRYCTLASEG